MFRGSGKKGGEEFDFAAGYISAVIKFINIIVGPSTGRPRPLCTFSTLIRKEQGAEGGHASEVNNFMPNPMCSLV